jgi:hypothetical protein
MVILRVGECVSVDRGGESKLHDLVENSTGSSPFGRQAIPVFCCTHKR